MGPTRRCRPIDVSKPDGKPFWGTPAICWPRHVAHARQERQDQLLGQEGPSRTAAVRKREARGRAPRRAVHTSIHRAGSSAALRAAKRAPPAPCRRNRGTLHTRALRLPVPQRLPPPPHPLCEWLALLSPPSLFHPFPPSPSGTAASFYELIAAMAVFGRVVVVAATVAGLATTVFSSPVTREEPHSGASQWYVGEEGW